MFGNVPLSNFAKPFTKNLRPDKAKECIFRASLSTNLKNISWSTQKSSGYVTVIPNGLEKYTSFNINNKLIFINIFHFLGPSLYSLVKLLAISYYSSAISCRSERTCLCKFSSFLTLQPLFLS